MVNNTHLSVNIDYIECFGQNWLRIQNFKNSLKGEWLTVIPMSRIAAIEYVKEESCFVIHQIEESHISINVDKSVCIRLPFLTLN